MASMDDLIATMSSGLQAGQHGRDLQDLHAKLASTISQPPAYRPTFPNHPNPTSIPAPHSSGGPLPPPAPVSSWNSPPPANGFLAGAGSFSGAGAGEGGGFGGGSPSFSSQLNSRLGQGGMGMAGTSPRQGSFKKEMGFMVPPPSASTFGWEGAGGAGGGQQHQDQGRGHGRGTTSGDGRANGFGAQNGQQQHLYPHHESVLPLRASPKDTGGFADDAFAPLWREQDQGGQRQPQQQQQQQQQQPIRQEQGGWSGRTRSGATFGNR